MAKKFKFTKEYEIRASAKMLYPYIQTAAGLAEWFAEEVSIKDGNEFRFIWDNEIHIGKLVSQRINKSTKFEFLPEEESDYQDPPYVEFKIDANEITNSTFLKITDYSSLDNLEELHKLWDGLIVTLKEIVGG